MINKITLENFKSIKDRVEIDIKPITLLFGPNSAGKSTVVQALHYLKEVLRYNLDPGKTSIGGEAIDLGGFANLVHRSRGDSQDHYKEKEMKIGIGIEEDDFLNPELFNKSKKMNALRYSDRKINAIQNAGYDPYFLEFTIKWNNEIKMPIVTSYKVSINEELIGEIVFDGWYIEEDFTFEWQYEREKNNPKYVIRYLNLNHPSITWGNQNENLLDEKGLPEYKLDELLDCMPQLVPEKDGRLQLFLGNQKSAFPDFKKVKGLGLIPTRGNPEDPLNEIILKESFRSLSHIFSTPIIMLKDALDAFRYIGPLRTIPERSFVPERYPKSERWSDGLGAWDAVLRNVHQGSNANQDYFKRINDWMKKLNTGYSIKLKEYKVIDTEDPIHYGLDKNGIEIEDGEALRKEFESLQNHYKLVLIEDKNNIEVTPKDIGSGVAQVFPIIAALADYESLVLAVEQPELHVHPAIQQKIADMVIGFKSENGVILLETHSEHIMLRLLRRIEETNDNSLNRPDFILKSDEVSVAYIEPLKDGVRVSQLHIDETGEFTKEWPNGFFDEREEDLF
jgi:AAA15 family ATPase/GTPase